MENGAIIKVAFLQSDRSIKFRPAVVIKTIPPFNDLLVCAVSTQLHLCVEGLDILLEKENDAFTETNLLQSSIIRTAMLATVPTNMVQGAIGKINLNFHSQLVKQLKEFL